MVGQAEITDCVTRHPSIWFEPAYGYGFVIKNPMHLSFRPCIGLPRFFDVVPPLEASVQRAKYKLFSFAGQTSI